MRLRLQPVPDAILNEESCHRTFVRRFTFSLNLGMIRIEHFLMTRLARSSVGPSDRPIGPIRGTYLPSTLLDVYFP